MVAREANQPAFLVHFIQHFLLTINQYQGALILKVLGTYSTLCPYPTYLGNAHLSLTGHCWVLLGLLNFNLHNDLRKFHFVTKVFIDISFPLSKNNEISQDLLNLWLAVNCFENFRIYGDFSHWHWHTLCKSLGGSYVSYFRYNIPYFFNQTGLLCMFPVY